jgi:hypothetical protein
MEAHGQALVHAALSMEKQPFLVPNECRAGWVLRQVWTLWNRQITFLGMHKTQVQGHPRDCIVYAGA